MELSFLRRLPALSICVMLTSCSIPTSHGGVLDYFHQELSKSGGSLERGAVEEKLEAARFLLRNMPGHTAMVGDYQSYYDKIDSVLSVQGEDWERKDGVIDSITQVYKSKIKYVPVEECISDEYLISDIEKSFQQWKDGPWARHLDFSHFCEYLLPCSVSEKQPLFDWRSDYYSVCYGGIGNLEECYDYQNDPHEAASAVNDMLHSSIAGQYRRIEPHEIPVFSPETYFKYPYAASCEENAELTALIMRAKGIPVAIDFTPQWPDRKDGHTWCVIWSVHGKPEAFNPFYSRPGVQFITHQRISKVFRRTYAPNRDFLKFFQSAPRVAKTTGTPFFIDVTDEYTVTSDVEVVLNKKPQDKIAYIAVFDNYEWHPVWYGRVKGRRAIFKGMGRDVTYITMTFEGDELKPISEPFRLDRLGNIHYICPDDNYKVTFRINRKFPLRRHVFSNVGTLRNGVFEASNDKICWDTLALLPKWPLTSGIVLLKGNNEYRYWQFTSKGSRGSDMAEVFFYDSTKVYPKYDYQLIDAIGDFELLFDNDPLSFYRAEKGCYKGCVDFGNPVRLSRIEYILRGDGDAIIPGDLYEISYWLDGKWELLERITATDVWIDVPNAPAGALFYIKCLNRGEDNRIFQWDIERGIVWQ